MSVKSEKWHQKMYDKEFATSTIGSKHFSKLARSEISGLIKILKLKGDLNILDVPCGTGRHCFELAKNGFSVTGADINPICIKIAKKHNRGLPVKLDLADMADLSKYYRKFDLVLNLFSSFGYFSTDEKNEKVLRELVKCLKPHGKIVIHLINRDWLMSVFRPVDWKYEEQKFILEARYYDPTTKYNEAHRIVIDEKSGKGSKRSHRMRLYSKAEMVKLMKRCGLSSIKVFGGYNGEPFSLKKSSHPLYIGEKK